MKRVLAMVLFAAMLLGMLPAQVFATEATEAAQVTEPVQTTEATQITESTQTTEPVQTTDSAQETGGSQTTAPTLPSDTFFAPVITPLPEPTQDAELSQSLMAAAADSFTLYYQSGNGYIFPMSYSDGMSVEQGSYFNVMDMDDNLASYTYKVAKGDAEVDAYGMVTIPSTALVDSTVSVKITDASGNAVATRTFKVTAQGMGTFAGGYGTQERPYLIANATQFHAIKNYTSAYFMLIADINVGSMTPLESFSGVLDGCGYTLSGWSYSQSTTGFAGLIRSNSGYVKNLTLNSCTLGSIDGAEGDLVAGVLCGINYGTIENVVVRNCSLSADVGSKSSGADNRLWAGFLCGVSVGAVRRCGARENTMNCYAGSGKDGGTVVCVMGGLVGDLESTGTAIEDCYSYGNTMSGEAKGDNWTTGALWWKENHGSSTYFCTGGLIGQVYSSDEVYMVTSVGYGNSMSGGGHEGLSNQSFFGAFLGAIRASYTNFRSCYSVGETLVGNSSDTFSGLSNASSANISALSGFSTAIWMNESSGRPVIAQNTSLTIDTTNAKTQYLVGEPLNYNGLGIYAKAATGATTLVERGYRISGYERNYAEGTEKQTVTVTYGNCSGTFDCYPRAFHNLCILYKDEAGNIVGREYRQVPEGDSFTFPTSLPGYVPREVSVSGAMGTEDLTVSVVCDPKEYNVIIRYWYSDDTKAAQPYQTTITYGEVLTVTSPTVIGYKPSPETVTFDTTSASNILRDTLEAAVYYLKADEVSYTVVTMFAGGSLTGTSVTFNGQTKLTDSNGQATFTHPYGMETATLQIQAEGYFNALYKDVKEYKLKTELGIDYFTMYVDTANNANYSVSGISCYGNDIEKDFGVINVKYEDIVPIVVQGNVQAGDKITKMLLVQEVETTKISDDDQTICGGSGEMVRKILQKIENGDDALESDGTCEFQVKGTCFSHNILKEYPILVYMYTELGGDQPVIQKLNIGTVQLATELKFDGLFDDVEMSLADTGIDFLNGTKLSFGLEEDYKVGLPFSVEIKNNEVYIAYNMSDEFKYQMKLMDKNGIINKAHDAQSRADSFMKYMGQKLDDKFAGNKLFNTTTTASFKIDSEFAGGFCFTVYPDSKIAVKSYLKVALSMNASWTTDFMILYIPLTVEVKSSLEGELTITGMGFDFSKQEIVWPSTSLDLKWKLGLSAGIGNRYASAGAFGRISIGTTLVIGEETYFDALIFNGEAGFYAKLNLGLLKLYGEKSWKFLDKTITLVPKTSIFSLRDPELENDPGYVGEYEGIPVYDVSSYTLMTAEEEVPEWTVPDADVLDSDGIDTASARILTIGDDRLAVYFGEDTQRDVTNAKTLMYRAYDADTKSWSAESPVDSNGTGDTSFDMILYNGTVYLAYAEAGKEFAAESYGEDTTALINDMAFSQEISVMRYDAVSQSFTAVTAVEMEADNYYDSLPTLGVVNGKLYLSWNKNTAQDSTAAFGMNTDNYIWSCSFDGSTWTDPVCLVHNCYPVVDMKVVGISGLAQVALIVDEDASLYTEDDRNLYFADMSGKLTYVNCYGAPISSLQVAQVKGISTLLWRSGAVVMALQDLNAGAYQFSASGQTIAEDFRFINISDSLHALVWSDKDIDTDGEITSDLKAAYQWENNEWTAPAVLKTVPYHLMSYDLHADTNGIHIIFTDTYMVTPEETGEMTLTSYSKLLYSLRRLPVILTVDAATVDVQEDAGKVRVEMTLTNNGACVVNTLGITVTDILKEPVVNVPGGGGTVISVASASVLADTQSTGYSEEKTYKVTRSDYDLGDFDIDLSPGQTVTLTKELTLTEAMEFAEYDFTFDVVAAGYTESEESGGILVGGNVIQGPGRPGLGGEYTSELYYPDVLVEGEYIIIDETEYISLRVENKGEAKAYGYLHLCRQEEDSQTEVYSVYISGLLPGNVKYYLVKLEKDFFEATMEEFLCTVDIDGDSDKSNNEILILAKKLAGEQGAQKDVLVEAPALSDYIQTFDKYAPENLQLDISMSEDILSFYGCVDAQKAPVDPDYTELEAGKLLRATFRQDVLAAMEEGTYEYSFLFQTAAGYIDAVYTLQIVDTTPIPIRGTVFITDETGEEITSCQRGTALRVNIDDVNTDQLEFAWIVNGEVVSDQWQYTVGEDHLGSKISVTLSGVSPYCGTLKTQSVTMEKVARTMIAPVVLPSSSGTTVDLQKTFHVGNDTVSYGYAKTNDASKVEAWTEGTQLILPEDGIYYLFAKAPGTDVYQGAVSAATVYSTTGEVKCHNYVDGYCTICGEADPDSVKPLFTIPGVSMTLGNDLAVYFWIPTEHVSQGDYIRITKTYADGREDVVRTIDLAGSLVSGSYYLVPFNGISAKEMTDALYATVFNSAGEATSMQFQTSVETYALNQFRKANTEEILKPVLADMLNYGTEAQLEFDYATDKLANANMSEAEAAYATVEFDISTLNAVSQKGDICTGMSLSLKSSIVLNVFYNTADLPEGAVARIHYTDHKNREKNLEIPASSFSSLVGPSFDYRYLNVDTLVASDIETVVSIDLYDGETLISESKFNVASYCVNHPENAITVALAKFCTSAYRYFHA